MQENVSFIGASQGGNVGEWGSEWIDTVFAVEGP